MKLQDLQFWRTKLPEGYWGTALHRSCNNLENGSRWYWPSRSSRFPNGLKWLLKQQSFFIFVFFFSHSVCNNVDYLNYMRITTKWHSYLLQLLYILGNWRWLWFVLQIEYTQRYHFYTINWKYGRWLSHNKVHRSHMQVGKDVEIFVHPSTLRSGEKPSTCLV